MNKRTVALRLRRFWHQALRAMRFGVDDPHVFPVVGKFLAAIQTDEIGAGDGCGFGTGLTGTAGDKRCTPFVPAAENPPPYQRKKPDYHKTPLQNGGPLCRFTPTHSVPKNVQ